MQSLRIGWLRPTFLYAAVSFFLFWTLAPVLWIAIMSVQPEINYVSVPPRLRLEDVSLQWLSSMFFQPDFLHALTFKHNYLCRNHACLSYLRIACGLSPCPPEYPEQKSLSSF